MPETVGLIGVGLLGTALAERLLQGGFRVIGHDVDSTRGAALRESGGRFSESPSEVFQNCRRVLLSLPHSDVVARVIQQCGDDLKSGAIVVDTTTGSPDATETIGRDLSIRDIEYLDATVAGSSQMVREGQAIVMVGGSEAAYEAVGDLLRTFAKRSFYIGGCGNGARMKLVVNLALGLNRAVLAEALSFARKSGIDADTALDVLQSGPAHSRAMDHKGRKMIDEDFEPQARLAQHLKDVRLILESGRKSGASLPLSELHAQLLDALVEQGFGQLDNSAVIKAFQSADPPTERPGGRS